MSDGKEMIPISDPSEGFRRRITYRFLFGTIRQSLFFIPYKWVGGSTYALNEGLVEMMELMDRLALAAIPHQQVESGREGGMRISGMEKWEMRKGTWGMESGKWEVEHGPVERRVGGRGPSP